MTAVLAGTAITQPGVYDIPADVYHADPVQGGSLSSTGARRLLPPSCPALFRYAADHPEPAKREFDLGTAAHKLVLGAGPDLVPVDRDVWNTNAVKAEVAAVRAAGAVPLKRADYDMVHAMAAALRAVPLAGALLTDGRAEQTLVWVDEDTGVWCRALVDWLRNPDGRRMVISDYKSANSAYPYTFARSAADHGYDKQAAWYLDGAQALGLAGEDAEFLFIAQAKTPPYPVSVVRWSADSLASARAANARAREIYRDCTEAGVWPGYGNEIAEISLPPWAMCNYQEDW